MVKNLKLKCCTGDGDLVEFDNKYNILSLQTQGKCEAQDTHITLSDRQASMLINWLIKAKKEMK